MLTHCNAGWLAFADWGSALAPVYRAHRAGKKVSVFASETRPRCQGARLTAWELAQEGVDCALIADNAAGPLFANGEVDFTVTQAPAGSNYSELLGEWVVKAVVYALLPGAACLFGGAAAMFAQIRAMHRNKTNEL